MVVTRTRECDSGTTYEGGLVGVATRDSEHELAGIFQMEMPVVGCAWYDS